MGSIGSPTFITIGGNAEFGVTKLAEIFRIQIRINRERRNLLFLDISVSRRIDYGKDAILLLSRQAGIGSNHRPELIPRLTLRIDYNTTGKLRIPADNVGTKSFGTAT